MPQPIRKPCIVNLTGFEDRHDHAAAFGHIVGCSGHLEALLGHLLAYLTGANAGVAMAMFHSVTSTDAQRAMLSAAAEQFLIGAELDEFRDLMQEFRTRYGERSRLVHNLWGTSPDHPDKVLWCAAKDSTAASAKLALVQQESDLDMFMNEPEAQLWRMCSTYTVKDLENVFERLSHYAERVRQFTLKLQSQNPIIAARIAAQQAEQANAEQANAPPPPTLQGQSQG